MLSAGFSRMLSAGFSRLLFSHSLRLPSSRFQIRHLVSVLHQLPPSSINSAPAVARLLPPASTPARRPPFLSLHR
eukprot:4491970-Pleurochrysis_carterae.AAC.1